MEREEHECARELLDTVPSVMRFIRSQMRSHRALELTVPQFRSLVFIERTDGASLGEVAENLGLTPPSACTHVDVLESRGMVTRESSPEDRRRLVLKITPEGRQAVAQSRAATQKSLSAMLSGLDAHGMATITRAMRLLHRAFSAPAPSVSLRRPVRNGDS